MKSSWGGSSRRGEASLTPGRTLRPHKAYKSSVPSCQPYLILLHAELLEKEAQTRSLPTPYSQFMYFSYDSFALLSSVAMEASPAKKAKQDLRQLTEEDGDPQAHESVGEISES